MTPVLRYRNPGAAARWLCEAFGFQEHESAQESDRHVKYILLRLADSCVLVRPVSSSVFDDLMLEPSAVGGGNTHVLYVPIPDAELHCARAQAAGAKVELEPQDDGLGGRFYTCRDPEGHLWSFGTKTYGMAGATRTALAPVHDIPAPARPADGSGRDRARLLARAGAGLTLVAALSAGWLLYEAYTQGAFHARGALTTGAVGRGPAEPPGSEVARLAPQDLASDTAAQFGEEQTRRRAAEAAAAETAAKLSQEQALRTAAEARSADAEAKLAELRTGAGEARQAAQTDAARERREVNEVQAALEQRLAEQLAESARDKESAAKALSSAQEALLEQKAASARAEAQLEAVEAETARERLRAAAAAIAAGAEAAATRHDLAQLEQERARQGAELEAAYMTLKAVRGEIEALRTAQETKREPPSEANPEIAAAARQQLAQLQQERARQDAELEAAYTALNAIRGEIEALRAAQAEAKRQTRGEPTPQVAAAEPATAPAPARPTTPCAQAVQGKVRLGPKGSRAWPEGSLARLCHGAEASVEPARCFDELMRGRVNWGAGSTWTASHALLLCAGSKNARQTLDCFATSIAANEPWASAINTCRLGKP
jgi:uncharacterized glyoxalase superfamily protein PhnB